MNLTDLFDLSFIGRRGETALEFQGGSLTFGDIDTRSNRLANLLAARGFTKSDRLCVYLPNGLEIIDVFLACVKLGVIFVPINILYKDREISHILADADPKAVIGGAGNLPAHTTVPVWPAADLSRDAAACSAERP